MAEGRAYVDTALWHGLQRRIERWPEIADHPAKPFENIFRVRTEAEYLAEPLVQRAVRRRAAGSAAAITDDEHWHRGAHNP